MKSLEGVRVIDMTWVWSGPYAAAILGDLGADVIKIEHRDRLDNARLRGRPLKDGQPMPGPVEEISPYFHHNNRNKRSATINIKHPEGKRLLRELAAHSDILLTNFTTGVLDRNGLGYDELSAINPRLIMLAMTAAGGTGPLRDMRGYAPIMSALSGIESLVGYEDDPIMGMMTFAIGDPNAGVHAAAAMIAALIERHRTGEGQYIDFSQTEAMLSVVPEAVAHQQLTGRDPSERGIRHPLFAPHGIYPCDGPDEWLAIAVNSDDAWLAARGVLGGQALAAKEWETSSGRSEDAARLDQEIADRTRVFRRDELARLLSECAVAAAPVQRLEEVRLTEQFVARGVFEDVEHPLTGSESIASLPWRMSETPPSIRTAAPLVGQHTREILAEVLGMDDAEVEAHLSDESTR